MDKPIIQLMPAENGIIVQVQFGPEVKSYIAESAETALAIAGEALGISAAGNVAPDEADVTTPAEEKPKKKAAPKKKPAPKKKTAAKKEEPKEEPAAEETAETEDDGVTYTGDDLRRILGAAAKKLGGAVVLEAFKEFGFKDVAEVEAAGAEKIAEVCQSIEESMNA